VLCLITVCLQHFDGGGPRVTWTKGVAFFALVSMIALSGGVLAHAGATTATAWQQPRIFAVGHSWVVGLSSGQQIGYVDRLMRTAGVARVDADHEGFTSRQVRRLVDAPRCGARDLAIVQVGLNDVRLRGADGLAPFRRSLDAILQRLARCPVILVQEPGALDYTVPGQPLRGDHSVVGAYRRTTALVANSRDNVTLVRPRLTDNDYLADGLHPDRSGNRAIYRAVTRSETWKTFLRNR
jgi:lysophospholipase L1-like esterase